MSGRQKRWLILGLRALVSLALVYYLINMVEWPRIRAVLAASNPYLFCLAPPMSLTSIGCMAIRWRLLLERIGVVMSAARLLGYYLIGGCFNIFLPGVIGGDVVRMAFCARHCQKPLSSITGGVVLERVCGLVALFAVGGMATFMVPEAQWMGLGVSIVPMFRLTAVGLLILFAIVWVMARWVSESQGGESHWLIRRIKGLFEVLLRLDTATLAVTLVLSAIAQGIDLIIAFVLAKALGIDLPLGLFFIIIPVTYLVTLLPVSLGGIGVREGIFTYLLTRVGVLASDAVTLAFMIYLLRVFMGIIGGLWYLVSKETSI